MMMYNIWISEQVLSLCDTLFISHLFIRLDCGLDRTSCTNLTVKKQEKADKFNLKMQFNGQTWES